MKKPIRFLTIITFVAFAFFLMNAAQMPKSNFNQSQTSSYNSSLKDTNRQNQRITTKKNVSDLYEIKAIKLPKYIDFAGEPVPLNKANIRERLDREILVNTYWQSNGLLLIKRANKYFPIIEPLLRLHDLPDDFKYLCVAESGLMNNKSGAGAAGFWHFLKGTAREYGLEVNKNVDERYNLEKATAMAAKYLRASKNRLGSWTLAAAAYNAGNARISQRMREQNVENYYDLYLNDETSRYVFRILALKEIMSNPEKYGFLFEQEDLYEPIHSYEVEVDTPITNIANFANKYGVTYKELKLENAWLRETKLNNASRKKYKIRIPLNH
ncbi:lytic transglycosylase domain-containing protein [Tenacibaculum sp. IB213877]|jgi:membrane-bound lytic murein transglycosylase D|uniref:lytic transglycosylase domain-containing protein n=1 Tax=Tenacibaculum sp. IB213877 TaxID=3097351 RepID=UPI002A59B497|nr:lytic transglycosylase domain-containing protein [Tenacibaculum sp. IB213877]MDY0779879.1 lytic transglycosylase domain-containing protein [Tenacibaculum sp. IB213877]